MIKGVIGMQSLRVRLEPNKNEILRVTAEQGYFAGMRYAGVRDCIAWGKWLKSQTGNENFGLSPTKPTSLRNDYWFMHQAWMEAHKERLSLLITIHELEEKLKEVEQRCRKWEWKMIERGREVKLSEVV